MGIDWSRGEGGEGYDGAALDLLRSLADEDGVDSRGGCSISLRPLKPRRWTPTASASSLKC